MSAEVVLQEWNRATQHPCTQYITAFQWSCQYRGGAADAVNIGQVQFLGSEEQLREDLGHWTLRAPYCNIHSSSAAMWELLWLNILTRVNRFNVIKFP